MKFLAVDVETANADYSSICQIGIVHFDNGQIIDKWSTLINPEAYFDPFNISIHGITEKDVIDAPTFDSVHGIIKERLTGQVTVHHMPFDKVAITRACLEYGLEIIQPFWLDSAKIVRRTWEEFAYRGYGLANILKHLRIEFQHHDALEDALAAGLVVQRACEQSGMDVNAWVERVVQPLTIYKGGSTTIKLDGNPEGSFYGETLVFTGALSLPRSEAAKIAADIGCDVANSVTKKTTILVVGTQDASKLAGYDKSSKHRKVEGLVEKGNSIKILSEKDFIEICNQEVKDLHLDLPKPEQKFKPEKQEDKPKNSSLTFELTIDETLVSKELNEAWNKLNDEQKELLIQADEEQRKLIDSIIDPSQDEKRQIGKEFKNTLEDIITAYNDLYNQPFNSKNEDLIDLVYDEVDQLKDLLFDLMKNKISLAEFFETLYESIDGIESELDEGEFERKAVDFSAAALHKLNKMKKKILTHSNKH